ncbi:23S rRNA (uracil(1939)-C(5))-methyltransferase RlmD [soil metagenome]
MEAARRVAGGMKRPRRAVSRTMPVHVRIDSIAAGGEGVGRLADGRVVFAHRTAPGDLAELVLQEEHPRWTRARLARVLEPSAERRPAPCRFYAECGGCTVEHLTYPAQLRAKGRIVADALNRIGGLDVAPPEVVPSPREHRYRNRVSFALRRMRDGRVVAGFHAIGDPHRIVEIDGACLLMEEPVGSVWDGLRAQWGPGADRLPAGQQLRLTLRANAGGKVSLLVEGGSSGGKMEELISRVPGLASVWHQPAGTDAVLIAGAPGLPESWGDETLELSGAAFLQVNRGAAALLEAHVAEAAGRVSGLRVVDAYCGVGLHARRLARAGATVIGLELDPGALAEARRAAPSGAWYEQGTVESLLPGHLPADLVILNPPRAGAAPEVTAALQASPPPKLIYISCNPATLARDLKRMNAMSVTDLRAFDLFPQTAHVETVVVLSPNQV